MPQARGRGSNSQEALPVNYTYARTDEGAPSHQFGIARGANSSFNRDFGWVDTAAPGRGLYYGGQNKEKIRTAAQTSEGFGYLQAAHNSYDGIPLQSPARSLPDYNNFAPVDMTKALTRPGINTTGKHVTKLIEINDIMGQRTRLAPESLSSSRA